jgi:hypothetical protein
MAYRIPILAPHLEHVARVTRNKSTLVQRATETDGPLPIRVGPAKTLVSVSPLGEATQCSRILCFSGDACEAWGAAIFGNLLDVVEQLVRHTQPSEFGIHDHALYIAFAPGPLNLSESHAFTGIINADCKGIPTVCKKLLKYTYIPDAENIKFVS